uniref:Disease resistance protein RPM1 n=1 Tax=Triticum urartu TaxID=4572 RepID=A0A8R7JXH4_TRIUA
MRQWITAGFIMGKEESKTLEEVAEGYLAELVNRSLQQVVERNFAGRLKQCRMHDVIRLLALNKAKEECFGTVYNGSSGTGAFCLVGARRISILGGNIEQLSLSGATQLRTLHVFENYINVDYLKPILTTSNLLCILELQGTGIKMLPNEVFDLFNLRYLGLRDTEIESLPEALGRLQNLEILDAYDSNLTYFSKSVVKLQKLRYLYACTLDAFGVARVKVPSGMQHLAGLRALHSVKATPEFLREVAALTELRTFGVCNVRSEHSADLTNAITRMSHLVHLEIVAAAENEVLQLEGLYLPATLSGLGLVGQLGKTMMPQLFSSWSHLNSLTRLQLVFSNIDEETFSCLHVLHGLCSLMLRKAFEGKRLEFYAGSFPELRHLEIWGAAQLNQVGIEEGAMQNLVKLWFGDCLDLRFLPDGIEHLAALEKLGLKDTSEELIEKLRQERDSDECSDDLMEISHIRNVTVALMQKGLVERIR